MLSTQSVCYGTLQCIWKDPWPVHQPYVANSKVQSLLRTQCKCSISSDLGCVCYNLQIQGEQPHALADKEMLLRLRDGKQAHISVCACLVLCLLQAPLSPRGFHKSDVEESRYQHSTLATGTVQWLRTGIHSHQAVRPSLPFLCVKFCLENAFL